MPIALSLFFSNLWVFLKPFVIQLLTSGGIMLAKYAVEAVTTISQTMGDADGDTKRKEAFSIITINLKQEGVEMATSTINAAIEAAVVKIKAESVASDTP